MISSELALATVYAFGLSVLWMLTACFAWLGYEIWAYIHDKAVKLYAHTWHNTRVFGVTMRVLRKHKIRYRDRFPRD